MSQSEPKTGQEPDKLDEKRTNGNPSSFYIQTAIGVSTPRFSLVFFVQATSVGGVTIRQAGGHKGEKIRKEDVSTPNVRKTPHFHH